MSDEIEIIENITEIVEISDDDDDVEDMGYELVVYVDEDIEENKEKEDCIVIKDEEEIILEQKPTKPENSVPDTDEEFVYNLDFDGIQDIITASTNKLAASNTNPNERNVNMENVINAITPNATDQIQKTIVCKRKRPCKINTNKSNENTDVCNESSNKVSISPNINESVDIEKSRIFNKTLIAVEASPSSNNDGCNNVQLTELSDADINNQSTSVANTATSKITRKRSNIYDFSKLKWLKPLRSLSSPPHLQIVIVDRSHPHWRITNDNWLLIEKRLLEALNSEMLKTNDASIGLFDGAKWQRGIKIVGCHNENAFNFITKFILNLDNLWNRAQLDVFSISQINRYIVAAYIPPPTLKNELVLSLIKLQNPTIHSEDWKILRQRKNINKGGVHLWFSVNEESYTHLCRQRGEIKYGINRIFVKPSK